MQYIQMLTMNSRVTFGDPASSSRLDLRADASFCHESGVGAFGVSLRQPHSDWDLSRGPDLRHAFVGDLAVVMMAVDLRTTQ